MTAGTFNNRAQQATSHPSVEHAKHEGHYIKAIGAFLAPVYGLPMPAHSCITPGLQAGGHAMNLCNQRPVLQRFFTRMMDFDLTLGAGIERAVIKGVQVTPCPTTNRPPNETGSAK
jgi:hypothetical protein